MDVNEFVIERNRYRSRPDPAGGTFILASYYAYTATENSVIYRISASEDSVITEVTCTPTTVLPSPIIDIRKENGRWDATYSFPRNASWNSNRLWKGKSEIEWVSQNVLLAERLANTLILQADQLFSEEWNGSTTPEEAKTALKNLQKEGSY